MLPVVLILLSFSFEAFAYQTQFANDRYPADTQSSLSFEHRHLHSVTDSGQIIFADVKGDSFQFEGSKDNEPLSIRTRSSRIYRPSSFGSFTHERRQRWSATHDRLHLNNLITNVLLDDNYEQELMWIEETVEVPDITDRETLLSLAKMTRNAYLDVNESESEEWYELDDWNRVCISSLD